MTLSTVLFRNVMGQSDARIFFLDAHGVGPVFPGRARVLQDGCGGQEVWDLRLALYELEGEAFGSVPANVAVHLLRG
jgi:hypothetical protein